MSSPGGALSKITEIGNYAIPAFGAVITSALALGSVAKEGPKGLTLLAYFALFTIVASYVAYIHRLLYLRHRTVEADRGKAPPHLPTWTIVVFLIIHGSLIGALCLRLYIHGLL